MEEAQLCSWHDAEQDEVLGLTHLGNNPDGMGD
jgi:hypothetical protein